MDNLQERIENELHKLDNNCSSTIGTIVQLIRNMQARIEELENMNKQQERHTKGMRNYIEELEEENTKLREAIQKTINDNLHLADGDNCTLRPLTLVLPQLIQK